ncbi:TnpV protein [Hominenteromicrobium sp.]|uniref:TnpV protein n=1 Tax=Hominenteromicrobium sp. TaxID=3073581 RepID=UPI003AB6668E
MIAETKLPKGVKNMELTYTMQGDYLLPDLTVPESPTLGKYGMLRRSYLKDHRDGIYTGMLLTGKLNAHLTEIDRQATEMMERLTAQMAKAQGVTESLKASDQMKWVQMMNNIRSAAEEIVLTELVYS